LHPGQAPGPRREEEREELEEALPDAALPLLPGGARIPPCIISVAVTVQNVADWPAAQKYFVGLVDAVFKYIGKPEPAGLVRAINTRSQYLLRWPYGVVWFNFVAPLERSSRSRTFWFRLPE
jgi:hypothetical protein